MISHCLTLKQQATAVGLLTICFSVVCAIINRSNLILAILPVTVLAFSLATGFQLGVWVAAKTTVFQTLAFLPVLNLFFSRHARRQKYLRIPVDDVQLELNLFVDHIMKDFVESWYSNVSNYQETIIEARIALHDVLEHLEERLTKVDRYRLAGKAIQLYTYHLANCYEQSSSSTLEEISSSSKTHPFIGNTTTELTYLVAMTDAIFGCVFSDGVYSCTASRDLLVEIIAKKILLSLLNMMTEPDWLLDALAIILADANLMTANRLPRLSTADNLVSVPDEGCVKHGQDNFVLGPLEAAYLRRGNAFTKNLKKLVKTATWPTIKKISIVGVSNMKNEMPTTGLATSSLPEKPSPYLDEAVEAVEETDGLLERPSLIFDNVAIETTQTMSQNENIFTLYVIDVRCWYLSENGRWNLESYVTTRRHKEFVTLHYSLLQSDASAIALKDIQGPTNWKTVPFWNMTTSLVEGRRKFLARYLKVLLTKPVVNNSVALREFLAYDRDAAKAFASRAAGLPRFDQVFIRTVSEVLDKLSSFIPSANDSSVSKSFSRPRNASSPPIDITDRGVIKLKAEGALDISFTVSKDREKSVVYSSPCQMTSTADDLTYVNKYSHIGGNHLDGSQSLESTLLASSVIDIAVACLSDSSYCLPDSASSQPNSTSSQSDSASCRSDSASCRSDSSWLTTYTVVHTVKILFSRLIESVLREEIDNVTTSSRCVRYLSSIREALWPTQPHSSKPTIDIATKKKKVPTATLR